MAEKEVFLTKKGPASKGPYSTCVAAGDFLFVSGQVGVDPATGEFVNTSIENEARQVLQNLKTVLEEFGTSMDKVVKTTVFLRDMDDFARINGVYGEFFPGAPPARSCVQAGRLPFDVGIEIEAIALK